MLYLYEATGVRDRIGRRTKKSPASRVCVKNSGIDRSVGNRGHRIDFALDLKTNRRYVGEERRHDCRRGTPGGARHKTQSRHQDFHGSRVGHRPMAAPGRVGFGPATPTKTASKSRRIREVLEGPRAGLPTADG